MCLEAEILAQPLISVVVPAYNEAPTIARVVREIWNALHSRHVRFEILTVDDGSSDDTAEILSRLAEDLPYIRVVRQPINAGKSAAVVAGISVARGRVVAIQDADGEYGPADFLAAVVEESQRGGGAVIASRMLGSPTWAGWWQRAGNGAFTRVVNRVTGLSLTDALSGQKAWPLDVAGCHELSCPGWGLDVRVTLLLAQRGCPIREVAATYTARRKADGKKFGWRAYPSLLWPIGAWLLRPRTHDRPTRPVSPIGYVPGGVNDAKANIALTGR